MTTLLCALTAGLLALTAACTPPSFGTPAATGWTGATDPVLAHASSASSSSSSSSASTPTADPSSAAQTAAGDLTAERVAALAAKDKGAWMATVADPGSSFGADQAALFDRMTALPLSPLSTRSITVDPAPSRAASTSPQASPGTSPPSTAPGTPAPSAGATTTWLADLRLGYRLTGYDRDERVFETSYLLTRTPDGWRFTGAGPATSDRQPFDLPDLQVVSSPSTLVIGDQPMASLRAYLAVGDTAHDRIAAVWGEAVPAVIVVPRTVEELATQLGTTKDGLGQVAGITNGPASDGRPAGSDRVYINPDATAKLSAVGRQVIVTHELTHVTTRATTVRRPPTWLSEGFSDYVGFKAANLPTASVADALLDQVRAGKVPDHLPDADAFDPAKSTIEPAYNQAWLAVSLMKRTYGEEKVVAFYRAVCGTPTAAPPAGSTADGLARQAFETVLGTTQDAFVSDWVAYVQKLAR